MRTVFWGSTNDNWNDSTCFDSAIAIFGTQVSTGRFLFSILGGFGSGIEKKLGSGQVQVG